MLGRLTVAACAVFAQLTLAGPAVAATLTANTFGVVVRDGAGERNVVTVDPADGGVLVHDARSALVAGDGCEALDAHPVRGAGAAVSVRAGGWSDTVDVTDVQAHVDGGMGDDELALAPAGTLDGGGGDVCAAGAGARLSPAGAAPTGSSAATDVLTLVRGGRIEGGAGDDRCVVGPDRGTVLACEETP